MKFKSSWSLFSLFIIFSLVLPISAFAAQPSVIVTFVNFNPDRVDHGESYKSTFTGTFPADTVFDAYFESTVPGMGGYATAWQTGAVQNHFVSGAYPYGTYYLKKLYANGQEVWSGSKTVIVGPPAFANRIPKGFLDIITSDGIISGWALDLNHPSDSINVHIYFDGPAGSGGTFAGSVNTGIYRPDVNQIEQVTGNHGFNFNVPQNYRDGRQHSVYAYAIDPDDSSGASNNQLTNSPKFFTIGNIPNSAPQFSSCSLAQSTIHVGESAKVNYQASDSQNDPVTITVFWGDGANTIQGNVGSADYRYTSPGTFSIRATAADNKGASSAAQCGQITVLSNPTSAAISVSSVSFSPTRVKQGQPYTSTFTGNFPDTTVFEAVFLSTVPGIGGNVPGWQTGHSQSHLVTADFPCGIYTLTELWTTVNGQRQRVWSGSVTEEVIGCAASQISITSVSLSPRQVRQGEAYSSTFTGNVPIPLDKVFDAVFDSNVPGQGGYVTAWQTGPFRIHSVASQYPCGIYTLRQLLTTDSGGNKYTAWAGAEVVEVVGCSAPNRPPVISSCNSQSQGTVGSPIVINYQISDPDGDPVTVRIEWGDGTSTSGGTSYAPHTYNSAGTYSVTIYATDTKSATTIKSCGTIAISGITPTNRPPVISSCGPSSSSVTVGTTTAVSYSISDPDGDSFTVSIEWGDGTSSAGGQSSAQHIYNSAGTYSVVIFATDNKYATTIKSCGTIIVTGTTQTNRPPVISSCLPVSPSVTVGNTAAVVYSVSDPDGDFVTIQVNWGDGQTSIGGSSSATHIYNTAGTYSVTITATDSKGASVSRSCSTIKVNPTGGNNPPTILSCAPLVTPVVVGNTATINYAITDPEGDSYTVIVNWGDGTTSTGLQSSANHAYSSTGTFSVSITSTDSKGASSTKSCSTITVNPTGGNNPPTISSCNLGASSVIVGNTATINYAITDPEGDSYTVIVNWGDGTTSTGLQSSANHAYSAAGTFSVSITATDSKGLSSTRTCGTITVTPAGGNNPPVIPSCSMSSSSITVGTALSLTYAVSDPDGDTFTATVNWGDGSTTSGTATSASHSYSSTGTFSTTVIATDSKGASASRVCGSVSVTSGGSPGTAPTGKLQITDVEARIDGKRESSLQDNEVIGRKAAPESTVSFKVRTKNLFNLTNGLNINNINVKITIEGVDDGEDFEDEPNEFDLRPQGEKSASSDNFKLPLNIDDGDYNVRIEAEGRDTSGVMHNDEVDLTLQVKKEAHDVRILKFTVNRANINCKEPISISYQIMNLGRNDEDKASVEIRNDDLGIDFIKSDISLESGTTSNTFSGAQTLKINNKVEDGTYPLVMTASTDDGTVRDTETIELNVAGCVKEQEQQKTTTYSNQTVRSVTTQTVQESLEIPIIEVLFQGANRNILFLVFAAFIISIFFVFVAIVVFTRAVD